MKKELIYRNEKFEQETRAGLKVTFDALTKLLDIWNGLNVGPCSDLFRLASQASAVYTEAFQANIEVPEQIGVYKLNKTAFLNIVETPVPNSLYVQAKAVSKTPCFGYKDIWSITDGKVIQDEEQAEAVIHSQNIYAENEAQMIMGLAVPLFVKLNCFINSYFKVIPWRHLPGMPWKNNGSNFDKSIADLSLEVEQLRVIMSALVGDVPPEITTYLPADFDLEGFKVMLKSL
jgi:hypothetical protein